jgi:hypothetical protein
MKIFAIGFVIGSVVTAAVAMIIFLRLGEAALRIIHHFSGQRSTSVPQPPVDCMQCRQLGHHPGCPSLSRENELIFREGWEDATRSTALARPNHPAYMLARRLYDSVRGLEEARARMSAISMQ